MSVFKNIFKSTTNKADNLESKINWIPLTDLNQLEEIKELSKTEMIAIFKHSTRCGISRMVKKLFEKKYTNEVSDLKVYYLDLLNYRSTSNKIADIFGVIHQSPQLLLIKDEKVVEYASHYDITKINL